MTGYTGLFAMRCRAVWYVSGQLQPCGVERHSPVVPISASAFGASHAPLPCVACARCPRQKQSDQRDGQSDGMQAMHIGALVAHVLYASHLFSRCI